MADSTLSPNDPRIATLLNMIQRYSQGEYSFQAQTSGKKDDLDVIIEGMNTLARNRSAFMQKTKK